MQHIERGGAVPGRGEFGQRAGILDEQVEAGMLRLVQDGGFLGFETQRGLAARGDSHEHDAEALVVVERLRFRCIADAAQRRPHQPRIGGEEHAAFRGQFPWHFQELPRLRVRLFTGGELGDQRGIATPVQCRHPAAVLVQPVADALAQREQVAAAVGAAGGLAVACDPCGKQLEIGRGHLTVVWRRAAAQPIAGQPEGDAAHGFTTSGAARAVRARCGWSRDWPGAEGSAYRRPDRSGWQAPGLLLYRLGLGGEAVELLCDFAIDLLYGDGGGCPSEGDRHRNLDKGARAGGLLASTTRGLPRLDAEYLPQRNAHIARCCLGIAAEDQARPSPQPPLPCHDRIT